MGPSELGLQGERRNEATGPPCAARRRTGRRGRRPTGQARWNPSRKVERRCRGSLLEAMVISESLATRIPLEWDTRSGEPWLPSERPSASGLRASLPRAGPTWPTSAASRRDRSLPLHPLRQATLRLRGEPPKLHGPYWHWSTKVNSKSVNRRLNDREAALYSEWIDNDRRARELLVEDARGGR